MTRRRKHAIAVLLVFAMALGLGLNPTSYKEAQAAKKTVRLSKKSLVLTVGKMGTLQMLYTKKKVAWSVKSGKDVVKLSNKKKTKVTVVAKKAGKAKVVGKVGKKSYICTVRVNKKSTPSASETPGGKEVDLLAKIINNQIEKGADLGDVAPGTEGFDGIYVADDAGHITSLCLSKFVAGVSFADFPKLESINYEEPDDRTANLSKFDLSKNKELKEVSLKQITAPSIDVSGADGLIGFSADFCSIDSLRLGGKKTLGSLYLRDTKIGNELNLKDYTALVVVTAGKYDMNSSTQGSVLNGIDFTGCTALTQIYLNNSGLNYLTVTGCNELFTIECSANSIKKLTLSGLESLGTLVAYDNGMESLTIHDPELGTCPSLFELYVSGNNFKYLDLRGTNVQAKNLVSDASDDSFTIIFPEAY